MKIMAWASKHVDEKKTGNKTQVHWPDQAKNVNLKNVTVLKNHRIRADKILHARGVNSYAAIDTIMHNDLNF